MNNLSLALFDIRSRSDNPDLYVLAHTADAKRISFDQFRRRSLSQASLLKAEGVDRNKKVLVTLPDTIESHGLFHALIRLGAQIYLVHHDTSITDLNEICEQFQIPVVIGESKSIFQITADCVDRIFALPDIMLDNTYEELQEAYDYLREDFAVGYVTRSEQGRYVLESFTHGDLTQAMAVMDSLFQFDTHSLVLNTALPISHPFGTMINTIAPFRYGSTHFLFNFYSEVPSINRYLNQHKVNVFFGSPYAIDTMFNHCRAELEHCPEKFYVTGERLPSSLWRQIQERYQVTPRNIFSVSSSPMPLLSPGELAFDDIGVPREDVSVRISDSGVLEFLLSHRDDWQSSPDICKIDEQGHYRYVGRLDQQRVIDNNVINCLDIEDSLLYHPSIEDCQIRFDGDVLVANVVLHPGHTLSLEDQAKLITVPARWNFLESVPRTISKKKHHSFNATA